MDRNDIAWTGYIPAITTPFTREETWIGPRWRSNSSGTCRSACMA